MDRKISSIVWVSKNRQELLERSVSGFFNEIKRENLNFSLYVSGTGLSSDDKAKNFGLKLIDKDELKARLIRNAGQGESDALSSILDFALFGDSKLQSLKLRDTGANRNTLLLSLVDKVFLSVDDDILCKFASTEFPKIENPNEKYDSNDVIFDKTLSTRISEYFLNEKDCENAISYPEVCDLKSFLSSHENLLGLEKEINSINNKVAVTVSGIHGDSGFESPRGLQTSTFADPRMYEYAIKNKLLLRYVNTSTVTDSPRFMTMCAGFDNRMILPPFFPMGRNQDGVFITALKACLPNSLIGYVPWVVRHIPNPVREYEDGEVQKWRFRISELINLLLEDYIRNNPVVNRSSDYERYEEVGEYLENFSRKTPEDFLNSLRKICIPNLDSYIKYLRNISITNKYLSQRQLVDILGCIQNIESAKDQKTFCIPEELVTNLSPEESIEISKEFVLKYGLLLKNWKNIRNTARI